MTPVKGCQRGFTLLEMLIAMTVLAVGLFGLAELQITAMRANSQSASLAAATSLAQGVVEEIVAMEGDEAFLRSSVTGQNWATGNANGLDDTGNYHITFRTEVDYESTANLTMIEVTVKSVAKLQMLGGNSKRSVIVRTLKRYTT